MRPWEDALRREAEQKTRHIGPDSRVRNAVAASENDAFAVMPDGRRKPTAEQKPGTPAGTQTLRSALLRHKKAFAAAVSALAVAAVLAVTLIAGLWEGGAGNPVQQEKLAAACTLEINPAVMFLMDDGQTVTAVRALNADADVLLSEEGAMEALVGKSLPEAVVSYADRAFRLGYIDPEKPENAVRLSHTEMAGDTAGAREALGGYFREKGIFSAVLDRTLDKAALAALAGIDGTGTDEAVSEALKSLPELFGERSLADRSEEELKEEYRKNVEETYLYSLTLARLADNAARLSECATLLLRISELNSRLITHESNPMLFFKDYWSVKASGKTTEDEEFNALMQETEQALADYEAAGGKSIGSLGELYETASDYAELQKRYGNIQEAIADISAGQFPAYARYFIGILRSVGVDVSRLEALLSAPATVEEFIERLRLSLSDTAGQRLTDYAAAYESPRPSLSEEEYNAYLTRLAEKYGSLDAFWEQSHTNA